MTAEPAVRAFRPKGLAGRVAPFALTGVLALLTALPEVSAEHQVWLAAAAVLAGVPLVVGLVTPWHRLPVWLEVVPPALYIAAVVSLRHAAGGGPSGYSALFLVPVLWLAMYGTRAQVLLALGLVTVALVAPIVLVGAPAYPPTEWRRVLVLVGVGATLGLIVQRLVREIQAGAASAMVAATEISAQRDVTEAIITAASDAVVSFDRSGQIVSANHEAATLFQRADLVGRDVFADLVPDDQRDRLRAGFGRILASNSPTEREARFEAELVRADGSRIPVEIAVAQTGGPDGPRIHTFVRDTTQRRAAESAAREHLEDLDRLVMLARNLDRTGVDGHSAICVAARDLVGADFVFFYTVDESRRRLVVTGSAGRDAPPVDVTLDLERSVAGRVLRSGQAEFIGDVDADPRIDRTVIRHLGGSAVYLYPIALDVRPVGVLSAYWLTPQPALPERTTAMFGLFAAQAAAVVERADLLARLETLARTDALTGAANRRTLDEALEIAIAGAKRSGSSLSIVMLDLDHFKRYNDRHGHQAGDDLLQKAVAAWTAELRPGDTLARYGGEEFLAVLPSSDPPSSVVVAERLRATLVDGVTASAGVATWDGAETSATLISRADAALYRAKKAGRARTVASVPGESDA